MAFIDPTKENLTGNTNYENLYIYVNFKAQRRGFTIINADTSITTTTSKADVNLLGYKQNLKQDLKNKVFTTDYTEVYRNETKTDGYYEGFGITNISIEVNSSYVPVVKIDFVDIKGMSFFNKSEDSPYSILFDFPPPIFGLTVKGYYGYALDYKLHLLRHNTRFDAETGNYYISAEFVGNTFAPLADILFQNVLVSSKLEEKTTNTDPKQEVNNLHELIVRSKTIKNQIAKKLNEDTSKINNITEDLNIINSLIKKTVELENNILYVEILNNNQNFPLVTDENKVNISNKNFNVSNSIDNNEYFIILPIKKELNYVPVENSYLFDFYKKNFVSNRNDLYFISDDNKNIINKSPNGLLKNIKISDNEFYYIELTQYYKNIKRRFSNEVEKYKIQKDILEKNLSNILVEGLGFIPTIENVMEIICNDIDRWIKILGATYNESVDYISNTNLPTILNTSGVYPFPDYVNNGKKDIPKGSAVLSNMPEVKLVDNFIDAFIERKIESNFEPIDTSDIVDLNGALIWYPINPLDTSFYNITNKSPYTRLTNDIDIIKTLIARYYVYKYYTLSSSIENDNTDTISIDNSIKAFFNREFENFLYSITDSRILESLKNNKVNKNDLKKSLYSYLNNEFTNIGNINNILSSIDVNPVNDFSSIILSDKLNIVRDEIESQINVVSSRFGNIGLSPYIDNRFYLIGDPRNNYIKTNAERLILKDNIYKLKQIKSNEFGLTLNKENNIIFYDGNDVNKTIYKAFKNSDGGFLDSISEVLNTSTEKSDSFIGVILESLNIKTETSVRRGLELKLRSNTIRNTYNINNIIYNQYSNQNTDTYKKVFGYLNITYVPNLKHIITVLMNKSIIAEMPFLVKLYISSYVYAIENDLIDVSSTDPELTKFDQANKDFIYNVFNNNFISNTNKTDLFNNHVNIRKDFINLLNNLSQSDKNIFTDFYKQTVDDFNFISFYDLFINSLIENNNFAKDFYRIPEIENSEIINLLNKKSTIIVTTNNAFSNKTSFNIFNDFIDIDKINTNIDNDFNKGIFVSEFGNFFVRLRNNLNEKIEDLKSKNDNELLTQNRNTNSFDLLRVETYYSFKNFVDRWFKPNNQSKVSANKGFLLIDDLNETNNGLFSLFSFVDRWYNNQKAKDIVIDTTILADFENDYNINMLTVISRLLNHNGFEFYPLQNFIDYTKGDFTWNEENIFKPQDLKLKFTLPRFTCMYIGGKSKYLDSGQNKDTIFKNDGFNSDNLPNDSQESNNWFGFLVKFGDGKQSIFSQIELNTEEHQPTNESLSAMAQIMDSGETTPVPVYQNLFSVYEQRSYTCKVKMFGDVMIQPTQLFDLRNVPMFNGVYIILRVNHSIDGETNSMITEFEGVRLPKEPREFIINPYEIYGKNLIKSIEELDFDSGIRSSGPLEDRRLERKERKIFLVAGHNNNDTGATYGSLQENKLNIELRNLIKQSLDSKGILNEIEDDNLTLQQVVNNLNSKVQPNDIVIDIHFNSSSNDNNNPPGDGTEVFIKDGIDSGIIDIAKNMVNAISSSLGNIRKRKSRNTGLPDGVKLKSESYIEASAQGNLAMFTINAKVILIEVCFINNEREMSLYNQNKNKLAEAIANILTSTTFTKADVSLVGTETFNILNTLKYKNINDRSNPSLLVNKQKIADDALKFLPVEYYKYNSAKADVFEKNNISKSDYINLFLNQIELSAANQKLDSMLIGGILYIESKFRPSAVSPTGALGVGQFILSSGLLEVLRELQKTLNQTANVYVLNNTTFQQKNIKRSEILSILMGDNRFNTSDLSKHPLIFNTISSSEIRKVLTDKNYLNKLTQNIFNNPFIMVELTGLYLNVVETQSNSNNNLGILSISYNMGTVTNQYNTRTNSPYFDNLLAKYNRGNQTIKNKISRTPAGTGEGIEYPEKLIKEFLVRYNVISKDLLDDKRKIF
jgi:N-acetylmuramoyl-L-alanine amidase